MSAQSEQNGRVAVTLPEDEARPVLESGEIIGGQRIPWGSNYTFLVHIDAGPGRYLRAIYKPRRGERPLSDYPHGSLYLREYGAYILSRLLGWPAIPLTLVRDGPYGAGAVQLYVDSDPNVTYFDLIGDRADSLMPFAVFDIVANNADRKAGHCLLGPDGTVWSIDHGLTFHPAFKVRTVMLEFWGKPVPRALVDDLESLAERLESPGGEAAKLWEMLTEQERAALLERVEYLRETTVVPQLDPRWNVPWPLT